ncbi:hypothetical protein K432DRAFT_381613, partial [Lepidopterella palustris CBS 459.81]
MAFHSQEGQGLKLMTPAEKMAENGKRMLRQLDENPLLKLLLQPNPPTEAPRAKCCADTQDCQHFHVYCLEKILDPWNAGRSWSWGL